MSCTLKEKRFLDILDHKTPDKMPFYFPTVTCSVASELLGRKAISGGDSIHFYEEKSWLMGENAHDEFVAQYYEDTIAVHKILRADILRMTWRNDNKPTKMLDENTLLFGDENGKHIIRRYFPEENAYGTLVNTVIPQTPEELIASFKEKMDKGTDISAEQIKADYAESLTLKELTKNDFAYMFQGCGLHYSMVDPVWLMASALYPDVFEEYFLFQAHRAVHVIDFLATQGARFLNGGIDIATGNGTKSIT